MVTPSGWTFVRCQELSVRGTLSVGYVRVCSARRHVHTRAWCKCERARVRGIERKQRAYLWGRPQIPPRSVTPAASAAWLTLSFSASLFLSSIISNSETRLFRCFAPFTEITQTLCWWFCGVWHHSNSMWPAVSRQQRTVVNLRPGSRRQNQQLNAWAVWPAMFS